MRAILAVSMLILGATMAGAQAQTASPTGPSTQYQTVAFLPSTAVVSTANSGMGPLLVSSIPTQVSDNPTAPYHVGNKAGVASLAPATDTGSGGESSPDTALALLVAVAMGATVVRRSGGP